MFFNKSEWGNEMTWTQEGIILDEPGVSSVLKCKKVNKCSEYSTPPNTHTHTHTHIMGNYDDHNVTNWKNTQSLKFEYLIIL